MGTIDGPSVIDGVDRLIAYRKVGPYPVYAAFGVSHRAALAGWWRNVAIYGFVAAMSALALLIASAFVLRQTDLWRQATADLQATAAAQARTEEQLRQSQKMEAVGRLTGGVAHDFNNLLTVVMGSLDLLKRRLKDGDERQMRLVDNALEGANRAASLTHRLLAFSRQQPLEPKALDANKLVSGMSELLRRTLGESIEIETVLAGGLWPTFADPNQLESALLNLAVNARDAMPDGGKLTIETANGHLDEAYAAIRPDVTAGQYVMVCVSDTGTGMSPDVVARAFEPFFTTKPIGKGTGLGLSQVYGFAKQSFGHVTIYSEPGQGTTIKLYLPRHSGQSEAVAETTPQTVEPVFKGGGDQTVLVVEDEDLVRQFSVAALSEAGYRVLDAADGARALEIIDAHPEIALLFTDVVLMGAFNGRTLADAALKRRPDLKVLFTTGYTRNAIIHHGRLDEDVDFIGKPFNTPALVAKVRSVLAAAAVDGAAKA
jgi:signal transduction histidine kinase/ActR/RegA family two-component response regulator